jgi:hypothetical protein
MFPAPGARRAAACFGLDSTASFHLPVLSIVSTGVSFLLRLSNGQRSIPGLFFSCQWFRVISCAQLPFVSSTTRLDSHRVWPGSLSPKRGQFWCICLWVVVWIFAGGWSGIDLESPVQRTWGFVVQIILPRWFFKRGHQLFGEISVRI